MIKARNVMAGMVIAEPDRPHMLVTKVETSLTDDYGDINVHYVWSGETTHYVWNMPAEANVSVIGTWRQEPDTENI